jgi:uncharacterized protein (DUF3820 family)
MNTHGLIVDFGKWKGHLYTRVPVQYLKWMVQSGHTKAEIAKEELERRRTVTPELDITGHAIDSASNRLLGMWTSTKKDGEGLHAWLCRIALEAFKSGPLSTDNAIIYKGVKWVFEPGEWPVLKTVMPKDRAFQNSKKYYRAHSHEDFISEKYGEVDYSDDLDFWIGASPDRAYDCLKDTGKDKDIPDQQWKRLCNEVERRGL